MTATEISRGISVDIATHNGDDVSELTDATTCLTDEDEAIECEKVGKSPDDAERLEFTESRLNLVAGDTITIHHIGVHNWGTTALYPYDGAVSVDDTNKITNTDNTDPIVMTLDAGFIGALADQGSDSWACRLIEDGVLLDGDIKITEVDADLTTAVGIGPPEFMAAVRPGIERPARLSARVGEGLLRAFGERWPGARFVRQHTDRYAEAVAGALSFAGALQTQTEKQVAGTLSFAGALQKQVNLPGLAGALSFAGALQKQINKGVAGVLSFVGTLATLLIPGFDAATAMAAIRPGIDRTSGQAIQASMLSRKEQEMVVEWLLRTGTPPSEFATRTPEPVNLSSSADMGDMGPTGANRLVWRNTRGHQRWYAIYRDRSNFEIDSEWTNDPSVWETAARIQTVSTTVPAGNAFSVTSWAEDDGTQFVIWAVYCDLDQIWYRRGTVGDHDNDITWGTQREISTRGTSGSFPLLAVTRTANDRIIVAYDQEDASTKDVYLLGSNNDGDNPTWTSQIMDNSAFDAPDLWGSLDRFDGGNGNRVLFVTRTGGGAAPATYFGTSYVPEWDGTSWTNLGDQDLGTLNVDMCKQLSAMVDSDDRAHCIFYRSIGTELRSIRAATVREDDWQAEVQIQGEDMDGAVLLIDTNPTVDVLYAFYHVAAETADFNYRTSPVDVISWGAEQTVTKAGEIYTGLGGGLDTTLNALYVIAEHDDAALDFFLLAVDAPPAVVPAPPIGAAEFMAAIRPGIQRAPLLAVIGDGLETARWREYDYDRFVRQHTDLYDVGLAGVLSFGGTLQKETQKQVAGTLSFAGALQKQTNIGLAGVLSFVGDLVAVLTLSIAQRMAAIRPGIERPALIAALASDLERVRLRDWPRHLFKRQHTDLYSLALTGVLSFAGALQKETQKQVAGSLSFAGALQKQTNKLLAGVLSFGGALTTLFIPAVTVAQLMAAVRPGIERSPRLAALIAEAEAREMGSLVAGLYTRRNLLRVPGQVFFSAIAGVLSFAGALQKQTNKRVAGVLSFAGDLRKTTLTNLAGVLSFAGALQKETRLPLAGVLSFAGDLATVLNPLISAAGNLVLALRKGAELLGIRKGTDTGRLRKGADDADLKNR